ncbi:MAG: hypothetical protein KF729_12165 [Sandaracinaceae bacterium]|nr:hypothetical protein [Sandaracinaceae bacterium]
MIARRAVHSTCAARRRAALGVLGLLVAACGGAPEALDPAAPAPALPEARPGSRFEVTASRPGAGCPALVRADDPSAEPHCDEEVELDALGLALLRDASDAERAGLREPVDFDRWVVLAPARALAPLRLVSIDARDDDGRVTVALEPPCQGICGGASIVELRRRECAERHAGDAYLVPRPRARLDVRASPGRACLEPAAP